MVDHGGQNIRGVNCHLVTTPHDPLFLLAPGKRCGCSMMFHSFLIVYSYSHDVFKVSKCKSKLSESFIEVSSMQTRPLIAWATRWAKDKAWATLRQRRGSWRFRLTRTVLVIRHQFHKETRCIQNNIEIIKSINMRDTYWILRKSCFAVSMHENDLIVSTVGIKLHQDSNAEWAVQLNPEHILNKQLCQCKVKYIAVFPKLKSVAAVSPKCSPQGKPFRTLRSYAVLWKSGKSRGFREIEKDAQKLIGTLIASVSLDIIQSNSMNVRSYSVGFSRYFKIFQSNIYNKNQ